MTIPAKVSLNRTLTHIQPEKENKENNNNNNNINNNNINNNNINNNNINNNNSNNQIIITISHKATIIFLFVIKSPIMIVF